MTTTPVSPRPNRIKFSGHTADDGLFGPDSVTWRISALPQMGLAAHGAATLQMLHPMVMHMIDQPFEPTLPLALNSPRFTDAHSPTVILRRHTAPPRSWRTFIVG